MRNTQSLKKNSQFRQTYKNGKSLANRLLVLYAAKSGGAGNRLGVTVSKKVGNSVVRHRVTRLVKESYRVHEGLFTLGYDLVFIARGGAKTARYAEMEQSVLYLMKKHRLLRTAAAEETHG